jgi:crotonobetainyl-CoA:carnitine CoA-transferase CaiB-like acyl-CoA transferase
MDNEFKPLQNIRVLELSHMVMGPACGMFLGFLGAEVIKVEPKGGDKTRTLKGMGLPMFSLFNRGKKAIQLDLYSDEGHKTFCDMLTKADVLIENFKDGGLANMGLSPDFLRTTYPKLIVCSHKGFLNGPYKQRTALDEVVQMMTGLAYMTGPADKPLRMGSSVNDIMGGLFGAFAVLAAIRERDETGVGRDVRVGLFETSLLLVAQHMVYSEFTGEEASPMPEREHSWPIYDIFETKDDKQIFVGVVTGTQWHSACQIFSLKEIENNSQNQSVEGRLSARPWILPLFKAAIAQWLFVDLQEAFVKEGIPFSMVNKPSDMFNDPHVMRKGGLVHSISPDGKSFRAPALPFEIDGEMVAVNGKVPLLEEKSDQLSTKIQSQKNTTNTKNQGG